MLPAGFELNASAANGLERCSIDRPGSRAWRNWTRRRNRVCRRRSSRRGQEPRDGQAEATLCPNASKVANVRIKSPLLEGELEGAIYLAAPQNFAGLPENPFESLLAMYLVAEEPQAGVLVKLAGKVTMNETTGQVTTSFENTPELPFNDLRARIPCRGTRGVEYPCARAAPIPRSRRSHRGPGPHRSRAPRALTSRAARVALRARTHSHSRPACPQAPRTSTRVGLARLTTTISREDTSRQLGSVQVKLPEGLAGVITGVPECGEAQANAGTCPLGSPDRAEHRERRGRRGPVHGHRRTGVSHGPL